MTQNPRAQVAAQAKKAGQEAARAWLKSVPREVLLKFVGHGLEYGMTLDQLRSEGVNVPPSRDRDYSWGFFKQAKGKVHHALHHTNLAVTRRRAHVDLFDRLDRNMEEIRQRLNAATTEEQFQAIGVLCREALITLAQAVYDRQRHPPLDGVEPSSTDAKRMLEAFFAVEIGGNAHKHARNHTRSAIEMAVTLQHRRTADLRTARLSVDATKSVVNIARSVSESDDANVAQQKHAADGATRRR